MPPVRAPPEDIWAVVTDYEAMPEIIPNILSNAVHREAEGGRATHLCRHVESLAQQRLHERDVFAEEGGELAGRVGVVVEEANLLAQQPAEEPAGTHPPIFRTVASQAAWIEGKRFQRTSSCHRPRCSSPPTATLPPGRQWTQRRPSSVSSL